MGSLIIPILRQINPIPRILGSILILFSHPHPGLPKSLFPVGFPVKVFKVLLPYSILTTCPVHLNLLALITLTILGKRYKLWNSHWCLNSYFNSLFNLILQKLFSLMCPNIINKKILSNVFSLSVVFRDKVQVSLPHCKDRWIVVL